MATKSKQIKIDVPSERSSGGSFGKIMGYTVAGISIAGILYYLNGRQNAQNAGSTIQNDVYAQWATQLKI